MRVAKRTSTTSVQHRRTLDSSLDTVHITGFPQPVRQSLADGSISHPRLPTAGDDTIVIEADHTPPSSAIVVSTESASSIPVVASEATATPPAVGSTATPAATPPAGSSVRAPGTKFRVLEEINRGGMGVILRGRDRTLNREVAIKVLRDQGNDMQRARFMKEAQITGQLEHPNIVPVHEFGVDESGRMFFAMKLVRGRNLAEIFDWHRSDAVAAQKEFPLTRQLGILVQVCHAVAFAHNRGVVHRDLKPSNVMLGDFGEVMLMDWGLAKVGNPADPGTRTVHGHLPGSGSSHSDGDMSTVKNKYGNNKNRKNKDGHPKKRKDSQETVRPDPAARPPASGNALNPRNPSTSSTKISTNSGSSARAIIDPGATHDGAIIGTPAYMSPEQAAGEISKIDARSDVYALGAILYEMLTLHPPVSGTDLNDVLSKAIRGAISPPDIRAPDRIIPKTLAAVAMKALANAPEDRYPTVSDLRKDLEAFVEGRAISAHSDSVLDVTARFVRRHRVSTAVTAFALVALLSLGVTSYVVNMRERANAEAGREAAEQQRQRAENESSNAVRERANAEAKSEQAARDRERAQIALGAADEQRSIAENERQRAQIALDGELRHRVQSELDSRLAALALANEQIEHDEFAAAELSLDACAVKYRDWVWRRLAFVCRQDVLRFSPSGGAVEALDADGGGRFISALGNDGRVLLFDTMMRTQVALPMESIVPARCIAVAPDHQQVLIGGNDGALSIWHVGDREPPRRLAGHDGAITALFFLPDGHHAASGSDDGTVRLWDLDGGRTRLLGGIGEPVASLTAFNGADHAQRILAGGSRGAVTSWDCDSGRLLSVSRVPGCILAASMDGQRLIVAQMRHNAVVWDLSRGGVVATLSGHTRDVACARFSDDGAMALSGGDDGTVRLWSTASGVASLVMRGHGDRITGVRFLADKNNAEPADKNTIARVVSSGIDGSVRVWDARGRRDLVSLSAGEGLSAVAVSPDAMRIVTGDRNGAAMVWDAGNASALRSVHHGSAILSVAIAPDGHVFATAGADGCCRLWDMHHGEALARCTHAGGSVVAVCFHPRLPQLATAGTDGTVRMWDVDTGRELASYSARSAHALAFAPDGLTFACAGDDGSIRLHSSSDGNVIAVLRGGGGDNGGSGDSCDPVVSVAFSANGHQLIAASGATALLMTIPTSEQPEIHNTLILRGHAGAVSSVNFTPDGTLAISTGVDGTTRLWDGASGRPLLVLREHTDAVLAAVASPNQNDLITAGHDGRVIIWGALPVPDGN